ncbi:MAG: MBL fold metallo-hydrolase [Candidatus Omnitrophica bacterium]|nr:MBL fold metallo-hydrolase [Candidatus Omnitrophota bacterium]
MEIIRLVVGEIETNCYLVRCQKTNQAVIIDPGAEPEKIESALKKTGWKPNLVVLTHGHADHLSACRQLALPIAVHAADAKWLVDPGKNLSAMFAAPYVCPEPERLLAEGDTIEVGEVIMEVLHTPGHTPGSICLLARAENLIFTGDTLFAEGVGRTDLPGGSEERLWESIEKKLFNLPDFFTIHPGHGPSTTLVQARRALGS